jgi:hypothetical protein
MCHTTMADEGTFKIKCLLVDKLSQGSNLTNLFHNGKIIIISVNRET